MSPAVARPLYQQVLGDEAFARLAPALREFHSLAGAVVLRGRVRTDAPQTLPARLAAFCLGSPQADAEGELRFELDAGPLKERWTRIFPDRRMASTLRLRRGVLVENLGPVRIAFTLREQGGALLMEPQALHAFGIPCPRWLMPRIGAVETGEGRQLHFEVSAAWPLIGRVAAYRGHLDLAGAERPGS